MKEGKVRKREKEDLEEKSSETNNSNVQRVCGLRTATIRFNSA